MKTVKLISTITLLISISIISCEKEGTETISTSTNNTTIQDTCWYQCRIIGNWELQFYRATTDHYENSITYQFNEDLTAQVTKSNYLGISNDTVVNYSIINYSKNYDPYLSSYQESGSLVVGKDTFSIEGIYRYDTITGAIGDDLLFGPYEDDKLELIDLSYTINDSIYAWHFLRK